MNKWRRQRALERKRAWDEESFLLALLLVLMLLFGPLA
jgi:hypothetical protein